MSSRAGVSGKLLSLLIVWTMAVGGLAVFALATAPASQAAATCSQVSSVISGGWKVTTAQTCSGVIFTVDGSVYVNAPLTIINGGLSFAKDSAHRGYTLVINSTLTLQNSIVTTQTDLSQPYLLLPVTMNSGSSLVMSSGSSFQFPGWFNTTGASITMSSSTIRGIPASDLTAICGASSGPCIDVLSKAANITWSSTSVVLSRSTIMNLFEDPDAPFATAASLAVNGGSALTAYDSYIGVDFSNVAYLHNALAVDGTSNAYLYNVTVDESQNPSTLSQYQSAYVPAAGGSVDLFRWLHATATDSFGNLISGASIWSRLAPNGATATFPDNSSATVPSHNTLVYLGRTNVNWNVTGAAGTALLPLWTDQVTSTSLPNANSFGNYQEQALYGSLRTANFTVAYPPYPAISATDNNQNLTLAFGVAPICPGTTLQWNTAQSLSGPITVGSSVVISAHVTITDGSLYVSQQADACAYVKVASGGSLTLVNTTVWSNYPLVVAVTGSGVLTAKANSQLVLTQAGTPGLLESNGTSSVSVLSSGVAGDVNLQGTAATFNGASLSGPSVTVKTTTKTAFWDTGLAGVTSIALASDLGATVAFDVRNVTFDQTLTSQLTFSGTQTVQFTNVAVTDPSGTWPSGALSGSASLSRYWWLTITTVDGTGTLLQNANANVTVQRLDPVTLTDVYAPVPQVGDLYGTTTALPPASPGWPVVTETGRLLYRAFSDSFNGAGSHTVNSTYVISASAYLQGTTFSADQNGQATVTTNTGSQLTFSSLTPELSIPVIVVSGGHGVQDSQPLNTPVLLTATVHNAGLINVLNVPVLFYDTNVDTNGNGLMDATPSAYAAYLIANVTVPLVPGNGNATAQATWWNNGTLETSVTVSAVVDPYNVIRPETDNVNTHSVSFFIWPDLSLVETAVQFLSDPVVSNPVQIKVTVHNDGTNIANGAILKLDDNGVQMSTGTGSFSVPVGGAVNVYVTWVPATTGSHTLNFLAVAANSTYRDVDYLLTNNLQTVTKSVVTQPDLALKQSDYTTTITKNQGEAFQLGVRIYNYGQTPAMNVTVSVYLDGNRSAAAYGTTSGINVTSDTNATINVAGIPTPGPHSLMIVVDPDNVIHEGNESNNFANVTLNILPPNGYVWIQLPGNGTVVQPTDTLSIYGKVLETDGTPIVGLTINITVWSAGNEITSLARSQTTAADGSFVVSLPLGGLPDGNYELRISAGSTSVQSQSATFTVHANVPFYLSPVPLLGIQWWLLLVIIAVVAGILIGVTVYFKVYGLGKMVECGECGAFIPEDATVCPKCGVEFEKDMAKCSNCQAWIPVDVKQCPECGVEFATGEVEMADYQEKMRLQYDEVVAKFKEDASRQLGRALSEKEFQEWWRKQPSFLTFEDWLREEEEMRKMGSKPCAVCGTLNSVTATVCHKCGSLMKQDQRPPQGGAGGAPPAAKPGSSPAGAPPARPPAGGAQAAPAGPDQVRRVIRKPIAPAPVVQKKVIKRPAGEDQGGEQAEGESQQGQNQEQQGDEL